jgi:FkbM family methyltransferase
MTVVDVGANIGYYLLMIEKGIGTSGKVICIEPSSENLPELQLNIDINHFKNVELHKVAIGATVGTVGLQSGINSGVTDLGHGAYQVPLLPLTQVVGDLHINFLKIDVEGYEGQVLDGAWEIVVRDRPTIFLEMHPHIVGRFNMSIKSIVDRLRDVYGTLAFYERIPPERDGLWHKIGVRYFDIDPLKQVADQKAYLDRYEGNPTPHTFWVVATEGHH